MIYSLFDAFYRIAGGRGPPAPAREAARDRGTKVEDHW